MKARKLLISLLTGALFLLPVVNEKNNLTPVPEWAKKPYGTDLCQKLGMAIGNDPTQADIKVHTRHRFLKLDNHTMGRTGAPMSPWLDSVKARGFYSKVQARRYGGDLQVFWRNLITFRISVLLRFILILSTIHPHFTSTMQELPHGDQFRAGS
jgi:hypothetical protein